MLNQLLLGYIDPFSGAIVIQAIIAGVVSVAAFFRRSLWAAARPLMFWKTSDPADDYEKPPTRPAPSEKDEP